MKHNFAVEIDAATADVWTAFTSAENLGRWMQNFESFTPLSGEPGREGFVAEFVFDERGRRLLMKETITECREPDFLAGTCETAYGSALIVNHFEAINGGCTRWTSWFNFTFTGLMRFVSLLFGGAIRRRTEEDMQRFRLMVESDLAEQNQ